MDTNLYHNLVWRKFKKYFPKATEDEINAHFKLKEKPKIFCEYCGIELRLEKNKPYASNPSIDHKIPQSIGGTNTFDNIAVCCHRCNIVKGTLTDGTFRELLFLLNQNQVLKERVMSGLFKGRLANKLERLSIEKQSQNKKGLWEI